MAGVICLAQVHYSGDPPAPLAAVLDGLEGPLSSLLPPGLVRPGDESVRLLACGRLTEEARDLFAEANPATGASATNVDWEWLAAERVERAVFAQMVAGDQSAYVAARRALIRHAAETEQTYADIWNAIGWRPPSGSIVEIGADRRHRSWWFPCPLCAWPMESETSDRDDAGFACSFEPHRLQGARFLLDASERGEPRLRTRGRLASPDPRRVEGHRMLARAVWRYVTVPGLAELSLADRLDGCDVEMWPDLDRVDLRVRAGGLEWELDVKDWTSAATLASHLSRVAGPQPWLVVPDHRAAQVPLLRERLPGRRVMTSKRFVNEVRRKIGGPNRGK
jgi:hypothetical protein